MIDKIQGFKNACIECLDNFSLGQLRAYGRSIGVDVPTKKKKGELILAIVALLSGEVRPIERSTRGAPVKDDYVEPAIVQAIARQRFVWFADVEEKAEYSGFDLSDFPASLMVSSPKKRLTLKNYHEEEIFCGQLEMIEGVPCLVNKSGDLTLDKLPVSVELIRQYGLREGDVITCHAYEKMGVWAAKNVLSINNVSAGTEKRFIYNEAKIVQPEYRIDFTKDAPKCVAGKYFDYLLPLGHGQRCLIASAPKAGKSEFLFDLTKSLLRNMRASQVFVLLIDQSPELISRYQSLSGLENFMATTFEAEPENHIFAAEFLLRRAKRYAEMGQRVVFIVDSLSKLAKAYNETADSAGGKTLPCGLENKTVHYIKKFFGAARAFLNTHSLTMVGSISFNTGDSIDDVLYSSLAAVANAEIRLSEALARRRIFPAVDLDVSHCDFSDKLMFEEHKKAERCFREKVMPSLDEAELNEFILGCATFEEFYQKTVRR